MLYAKFVCPLLQLSSIKHFNLVKILILLVKLKVKISFISFCDSP